MDPKVRKIVDQAKGDLFSQAQAFDNVTCFTNPKDFPARIKEIQETIVSEISGYTEEEKEKVFLFLIWVTMALDGSYELTLNLQNEERHKNNIVPDKVLKPEVRNLYKLLKKLEAKHKNVMSGLLNKEKTRMGRIMASAGKGLLAEKSKEIEATSVKAWIKFWAKFGKKSNLRKIKEKANMIVGVDYGLGIIEARILWGADLVMMNPTLARLALAEDDVLQAMKRQFALDNKGKLSREELVRGATKIAGYKARLAQRAVFLLTEKGKISFQVNPRTYNQPEKLKSDILTLHKEFNDECMKYDSGLFLEDTLTPEEIKARKGQSHVFYKVDGSAKSVYGDVDKLMVEQVKKGNFDLAEGDSGSAMEQVMAEGANNNVTVAGFMTDGLYSFFCQLRGHAKARKKGLLITHSIITKMGGRIEAALRWYAIQKLADVYKKQGNTAKAEEVMKIDNKKNGTLDAPEARKLAKEAGLILPEEITPAEYENHEGKLFPQDLAICTIAEAISKRSHKIMTALKKSPIMKKQGVQEWETGDLQASMRPPYGNRFPHVEGLLGMFSQGHFPDCALNIELWKEMKINRKNVEKKVNKTMIEQLYSSIIAEEFAQAYEVDEALKQVLIFFDIYKQPYGSKGITADKLASHAFAQQTLFAKVVDAFPATEAEKNAIRTGFIGDFNLLGEELENQQ
ncbi:MAG: hypothetical protein A2252_03505 [Elusimicrobia bacterium RIFOXYA2_FULL_39_19]|nr:MAG: hypothetical protein A2252_03505 [Elusimicrobia bacterium RIFOXYA2_FULL_39_19]